MKIENRLKQLASTNSNYSLLWAQWEFDKKLLHRALNTISRDFPHYSLHDSSHSSTIITQIEKVISPDIEKLSATDCWLLLEACYWHDAGMIISKEEKRTLVSSDKFKNFLTDLIKNNSDLSNFAEIILKESKGNDITEILDASDALTFVLSDYYRRIHADRSGEFVQNPHFAKIESPRTSLIPKRLFGFVASIISCHGKSREEILNVTRRNDGMDSDDYAHPRYVASLLRIGDLLDIDDGRFCQTLLSNIGNVPKSSIDHQKKHASIESLNIDSDSIEIEAICHDYDSYSAQRAWFDYIEKEFEFQKKTWNNIAPNNTYRALPTISKLKCTLSGYLNIDGATPRIKLDTSRVYDYLTGSLVYSEKYPFIRELIQNAIDATMYKTWDWMTHTSDIKSLPQESLRDKFEELLNKEQIDIFLEENEKNTNDAISYKLTIRDHATGISFDDIKKIFDVGSSNTEKRKVIRNSMPEWAKPSGYFGLGLHSIFKACKNVKITTRVNGKSCYVINVLSANFKPEITIKKTDDDYFIGTEITTEINELSIPNSVPSSAFDVLKKFDPLRHERLEITPYVIEDLIDKTFLTSTVKLFLNKKRIKLIRDKVPEDHKMKWISDYKNGVDLNLFIDLDLKYISTLYYKNSVIELEGRKIGFGTIQGVSGAINIFSGDAIDWVTIDRKKLRTDKTQELNTLLSKVILENRNKIISNTPDATSADLFFYAMFELTENNLWRNFKIENIELYKYLDESKEMKIIGGHRSSLPEDEIGVEFGLITECISNITKELKYSIEVLPIELKEYNKNGWDSKYFVSKFKFSNDKENKQKIDISLIKKWLEHKDDSYRMVIPCYDEKYNEISITCNNLPKWMFSCCSNWNFVKYLVLPFKNSENVDDDIDVVYDYFIKSELTRLDKKTFKKLHLDMWNEIGLDLKL